MGEGLRMRAPQQSAFSVLFLVTIKISAFELVACPLLEESIRPCLYTLTAHAWDFELKLTECKVKY